MKIPVGKGGAGEGGGGKEGIKKNNSSTCTYWVQDFKNAIRLRGFSIGQIFKPASYRMNCM